MLDINNLKFPEENRTFETRLLFIQNIFSNRFSRTEIMTSCVQHKLKRSFESYIDSLNKSSNKLTQLNPISVLKNNNSIENK